MPPDPAHPHGHASSSGHTPSGRGRELLFYTAPECSLCREAWDALSPIADELGIPVRAVDISGDPELERRYRSLIPVGEYAGRRLFKYRVDERRVRRVLEEAGTGSAGPEKVTEYGSSLGHRRFLVDEMLGRLARWLRALGHDAAWEGDPGDDALLEKARNEGRVLLTRDTLLMERRPVRRGWIEAHLVRDDLVWDQLVQLREELDLEPGGEHRCLVCNSRLEPIAKEEARPRVPEYVGKVHDDFRYCPYCDRVVWPGTHWTEMQRTLRDLGFRV